MSPTLQLLTGHAATLIATLPRGSVDCIVTSPPYWEQRDYGIHHLAHAIGRELTWKTHLDELRKVFVQAWYVLKPSGNLFLNYGDKLVEGPDEDFEQSHKLGLPYRLRLMLNDDGWISKSDIVWWKPNAKPESAPNRFSRRHEMVFHLVKQPEFYFNLDAVRTPYQNPDWKPFHQRVRDAKRPKAGQAFHARASEHELASTDQHGNGPQQEVYEKPDGANPGDVWTYAPSRFDGAHFATFPPELVRRCILAGSPEGGMVLDPFCGSGTTNLVALQTGRNSIGIDLNPEFIALAEARIQQEAGLLLSGPVR